MEDIFVRIYCVGPQVLIGKKIAKGVLGDGLWEASLPFPPIDQEDVLKPGTLAEIVILQGHYEAVGKSFIINVKFIKDDVVKKIKHSYDVYVLRTNKYENAVSWGGNIAKEFQDNICDVV